MIRDTIYTIILCMFLLAVPAMAQESEKEEVAVTAAKQWLSLVDNAGYGESWKEAAEFFRNAVTQEQWAQSLKTARDPLGRLISRQLKNKLYKTSLPGAPDGEYVVIEFETIFENKKTSVETVTPMLEKDGGWRVSGYFIK